MEERRGEDVTYLLVVDVAQVVGTVRVEHEHLDVGLVQLQQSTEIDHRPAVDEEQRSGLPRQTINE